MTGFHANDVAQILGAQVKERGFGTQCGGLRGGQELLGAGDLLAVGQLAAALEGEDGAVLQGDAVSGDEGGGHLVAVVFGLGHRQGGLVAEALHIQGASRATWARRSVICAGHKPLFGQRRSTSPSFSWTSVVPQEGHSVGMTKGRSEPLRASSTGATISGMTSPACAGRRGRR